MTKPKLTMTEALMRRVSDAAFSAAERFDSWRNEATGFGTTRDKTTYSRVAPFVPLDDDTISSLVHMSDIAERIVSVVPNEMLREGFSVDTGDADLDSALAEIVEGLELRDKLCDGIRWARAFGGAALVLGADDGQRASEPLNLDRVKQLSYAHVVDRRYLLPVAYYEDPASPKFGRPSVYAVTTVGGRSWSSAEIHETRLVIFRGATTGALERQQLNGWDLSVLQRPHDVLRQFDTGWKSVETMLTDANQAIFKMTGLAELISTPGGLEGLKRRVGLMDMYRSVVRALVIDADGNESFERQAISFEGIPQTLDKIMLRLAASVPMPVAVLMGQAPAGMNATGESDFRWWYDGLRAEQTLRLSPRIRRIIEVILRSKASPAKGKMPDNIAIKFPPLWTETPLAEAQRRKAIAETDAIYVTAQVLMPDEVALARFRPEGFDSELQLTEEATAARESALKSDLDKLEAGALGDEGTPTETPSSEVPTDSARMDASEAKLFELQRDEDETGVSGTGVVADGVVFGDGSVVLRWRTATASTTVFKSIDDMLAVHGHGGKTRVAYTTSLSG